MMINNDLNLYNIMYIILELRLFYIHKFIRFIVLVKYQN